MGKNRLKQNIAFNVLKTLMTILFPIATFTYVARVISVEGLGKVTFAKNFVSYFCLLASLGISYYGIREGAKVAKDKEKFSKLFWEIFIVNMISTTISFAALMVVIFNVESLADYRIVLLINSGTVIIGGLGCEWVLGAVEEYKFISIRTIVVQLVCLIIIFLTIRDETDYLMYAVFLVIAGYGPSVFNLFFIRKNKLIQVVSLNMLEFRSHLKPIFILFAMLVSIDFYTLLDTTMLGFIKGDRSVGIYTAAIKVPRLVNSLIASVGTVLVPRLAYYYEVDKKKFNQLSNKAMSFISLITIPCAIGLYMLANEIILLVCGDKYVDSIFTLQLLTPIVIIIPISVLFNNQIFIPMRKEIYVLKSTCIGAIVNLIANSVLIPRYAENGAAVATVLAEFVVMSICLYHAQKQLDIKDMKYKYIKRFGISLLLIPIIVIVKLIVANIILRIVIAIGACALAYFALSYKDIKKVLE